MNEEALDHWGVVAPKIKKETNGKAEVLKSRKPPSAALSTINPTPTARDVQQRRDFVSHCQTRPMLESKMLIVR